MLEIVLAIVPWIIWIKYRDRKQDARLLFTGLVVVLISTSLDSIGLAYDLWHYDWKVFPFDSMYVPWNFALFPVIVMFFLQIKPEAKPLYKALYN